MQPFSDPTRVSQYAQGPVLQVPGFEGMQRMAALLLAEKVPDHGQVLVLGAGGGLELKVFCQAQPSWRFFGVDPSAPMLALAYQTLGELNAQVALFEGYIDAAPLQQFDGATCLLTLHFLPRDERLRTLNELAKRLKPGAPLVVAQHSFPQAADEKIRWLKRYAAFAAAPGVSAQQAEQSVSLMAERLPALSPEQDEALLREAGFENIELFYAGFTFRGWVAYRAEGSNA